MTRNLWELLSALFDRFPQPQGGGGGFKQLRTPEALKGNNTRKKKKGNKKAKV